MISILKSITLLGRLKFDEPLTLLKFELTRMAIMDGATVGWLVYGNCLYFSKSNDCDEHDATAGANSFMFFLIVLGYFSMLGYIIMVMSLPILIYFVNR